MKSLLISLLLVITGCSLCLAAPPRRIVSLAPSVTETLCALGLERNLVGITSYCDRPATLRGKAVIGGPANPSLEAVVALRPDVVVADDEGLGPRLAARLERMGVRTVLFRGSRLAGLPAAVRRLGSELGVPDRGGRLAAEIARSLRGAPARPDRPLALFVIWPDPLVTAGPGTVLDDALRIVGLTNGGTGAHGTYPRLSLEAVLERDPQVLIIGPGHARHFPLEKLLRRLAATRAVRDGRICYVSDALYRPGPRIPAGIDELHRCADRFARAAVARQGSRP